MSELDTTFVWLAYFVTYGLVIAYVFFLIARFRRLHRRE